MGQFIAAQQGGTIFDIGQTTRVSQGDPIPNQVPVPMYWISKSGVIGLCEFLFYLLYKGSHIGTQITFSSVQYTINYFNSSYICKRNRPQYFR
jgi:hypothetical protein